MRLLKPTTKSFRRDYTLPSDLVSIPIQVPDHVSRREVPKRDLPANWRYSCQPSALKELGNRWLDEGKGALFFAPSAIVTPEHIVLINPRHVDRLRMEVGEAESFTFDPRLFK